jgi:hypothetical protein
MKVPSLDFEINIIKQFFDSNNKIDWFFLQINAVENVDIQTSLLAMFVSIIWSIYYVKDNNLIIFHFKKVNGTLKIILIPVQAVLFYYLLKLIWVWTSWTTTLGWLALPAIFGTTAIVAVVVLFIAKFIDKD